MTAKRGIFGAAVAFAIFGLVGNHAAAQKSGGILRQYIIDSPASMSIHEETTVVAERPMMGVFNNLVIFDQHVAQNSLAAIRPELATGWTWDEDGYAADLQAAPGGEMARRQAVHRRRRQMHLGAGAGQDGGEAAGQPAQGLVRQSCRDPDQRRLRGYVRPEAAAARLSRLAGVRHVAGLSLPRVAGADATAPDRHRPVQIRRIQAERTHQGGEKPGLLEAGAALSRRHRIYDRQEPFDRDPRLCRRQIRADLCRHADDPADPRPAEAAAGCDLRAAAGQRQHQSDRQSRQAAVRQSRAAAGDEPRARPPGLYRYPDRGPGFPGRGDAAAARRPVGHAARHARQAAGLRPGRGGQSGRGARDHEKARLRAATIRCGSRSRPATSRLTAIRR